VTYAQHYHATVGGIHFWVRHQLHLDLLFELTGWFAQIEPLGKTAIYGHDSSRLGRSEAVRCIAISAWCMGHNESQQHLVSRRRGGPASSAGSPGRRGRWHVSLDDAKRAHPRTWIR
jgi:hypothetical protein